jgi:hypothetical protein
MKEGQKTYKSTKWKMERTNPIKMREDLHILYRAAVDNDSLSDIGAVCAL